MEEPVPETLESVEPGSEAKRKRRSAWRKVNRFLNRVFGVLLVTGMMLGIAGVGVGMILTNKNYPYLREKFVTTMEETRRFKFVSRIFLSEEEYEPIRAAIAARRKNDTDMATDPSLIHIAANDETDPALNESGEQDPGQSGTQPGADDYGIVDEDGDGYILVPVSGRGYNGYMLIVLDPKRCFVARGGEGQTINMIAERNGAIGGINAGAFVDPEGGGSGKEPEGLTIIDGAMIEAARWDRESFAGFDADGILHVGYFSYADCLNLGIVGGVTFSPPLIINGVPQNPGPSGVNPRTAIGQRADGAVLMLVIDGRQLSSAGATYDDLIEVMLQFGAVNAMNLDGGSSTVMYLNGELVNQPSSQSGYSRGLPDAFLFR